MLETRSSAIRGTSGCWSSRSDTAVTPTACRSRPSLSDHLADTRHPLRRSRGRSLDMRIPLLKETGRGSAILIAVVLGIGAALTAWKTAAARAGAAAAAHRPEPAEVVIAAVAEMQPHRATATSIGTVLALRSITLRTELAGTVRQVSLVPGRIVDSGTVLVALDIS